MLHVRKIALLAALIALASAPTGAQGAGVPTSVTTTCASTGTNLISLGPSQTFFLTDVTVASAQGLVSVGITNTSTFGVQYVAGSNGNFTVTQKFETPIKFTGTSNSPFLSCSVPGPKVFVSIQGLIVSSGD